MKRTVLTFGLISGAILSLLMVISMPFEDQLEHGSNALLLGYATMILGFLLIYFGVRSYRDTVGGGSIGFGRALAVGMLIMFVSSACYVATWEVIYFKFKPDFADKYAAAAVARARAQGASQAEIDKTAADMEHFKTMYRNPVYNVGMTFLEPLPPGLIIALVSAGMLRRRRRGGSLGTGQLDLTAST